MKILITGATGLVGRQLVKELLSNGVEIHFLTTQTSKLDNFPNCKGFLWNPKENKIDIEAINGVTAIIHLAGANIGKRWTTSYKKEIIASRVLGTTLLYQLLEQNKHGVKHFITASGVGIYKSSLVHNYTEESNQFGTGFLADVVCKWEAAANAFTRLNIAVTKIRTGLVLDKIQGALPKMMQPIQMGVGAALGAGNQQMSWIHAKDLVRLYDFVLENKISGVINAVAPQVVTNTAFTEILAKQLHKKIYLPSVPTFMLKLLLGEMHLLLCESQKVSATKIKQLGFVFQYPKLSKALSNILEY